jgi:hypothetical protein
LKLIEYDEQGFKNINFPYYSLNEKIENNIKSDHDCSINKFLKSSFNDLDMNPERLMNSKIINENHKNHKLISNGNNLERINSIHNQSVVSFEDKSFNVKKGNNASSTVIGKMNWIDGSIYYGIIINHKANGYGKLIHPDGDVYKGFWVDDKAKGVGIYSNINNSSYQGYWKLDKQNGYGTELWRKGSIYEGYFKLGTKNGIGILKFEDNAKYEGEFFNNNISGIGTCYFKDNRKYEGEWKENKMNGYGTIIWPNGQSFEGSFVNDKKEGLGIYYSKNKVYIANWRNSKMHGLVTIIEKGIIKKSIWEDGKKFKSLEEDRPLNTDQFLSELINMLI